MSASAPAPAYRRRLFLNTVALAAGNGWLMVVTLVTLPVLLHGLGAVAFGSWVLVQTFSASNGWLSLADVGIASAMTRSIAGRASADQDEAQRTALTSGMVVLLGVGLVAAAALFVVGPIVLPALFSVPTALRPAVELTIRVFSVQVFFEFIMGGILAGLEGGQRVDLSRLATVATRTGQLGSTAVIALAGGGIAAVATGSLVATAIGTAFAAGLLARRLPGVIARPSLHEARALGSYGVQVAGINASAVLHGTMDRLVVGAVIGPAGVALVEIAAQVQSGASAVLSSSSYVALSASPWVAARSEAGRLREMLVRGTKYAMLATLPVVVGGALLARPLVAVWVGPRYSAAAGLIALALVYIALASTVTVAALMLEGTGHARSVLVPSLATTGINLVLSIVLVRRVGVAGAFIATIVSTVVFVPIIVRASARTYAVPIAEFARQAALPVVAPVVIEALAILVILALPLGDWATVVGGTLVGGIGYGVSGWFLSLAQRERTELRSMLRAGAASAE